MKKCPFCAEEKLPWYFRTSFIVIAILCIGPLALPLLWWRPATSPGWKVGLTVGILVLSWAFYLITMESLRAIEESLQLLESL